jgi:hypothetical protein
MATKKKLGQLIFPSSFLLLLDPESEIRDSGSQMEKNPDPVSRINIRDPQHMLKMYRYVDFIFKYL